MGQAGSSQLAQAPRRTQYHHHAATLPHEPLRLAPKVLPSLEESPRLRCTDNGAILHSGGTISGRRALSATLPPAPAQHAQLARTRHQHAQGVYRSRSASSGEQSPASSAEQQRSSGTSSGPGRPLRERDPLHRSHTHLDQHDPLEATLKKFGSEPNLRNEEEEPKHRTNTNKHFRKKYKAPQPPSHNEVRDGSSPDSCNGNNRNEPVRKLRLFKTRSETKNLTNQISETKPLQMSRINTRLNTDLKSTIDSRLESQSLESRYKTPTKERDQYLKYPDSRDRDMVQSSSSLRTEEHLLQASVPKHDYRKCKTDKFNAYRSKSKNQDQSDPRKTPHLDRTFRYSERFKRDQSETPVLRREKSFDATLVAKERDKSCIPENMHLCRIKAIGEQLKSSKLDPLATNEKPLRKSLPSLLLVNNDDKDEFQAELKRATNRIRNDTKILNGNAKLGNNKPSQNDINLNKCSKINPTNVSKINLIQNKKVKESSLKSLSINVIRQESNLSKTNERRNPNRTKQLDSKTLIQKQNSLNKKLTEELHRHSKHCKRESRITDRGQASGKESTPEHSPNRLKEIEQQTARENSAPSKQFYFGMIESKEAGNNDKVKDFPGLGSPIIEEFSNFHLIEKKLLGYHKRETEVENFASRLHEKDQIVKQISSESAISSSEEEAGSAGSAESRGISLHLRPTVPKKQLEIPRFSPAAAWRQLAHLETELAAQQSLAVEVKTPSALEPSADSPIRSEKSGDKSGDSGISGDHAHSDERLDSPPRPYINRIAAETSTWTPQQDLEGDSGSDGAGGTGGAGVAEPSVAMRGEGLVTYSARGQPFSLSLPRDHQPDKTKQFQQPFNSLQKLKKSVSGALGAALGSRRFDLEQESLLDEPSEQNWFLSKSAPNSLTNPLMNNHNSRPKCTNEGDIKEEPTPPASDQEDAGVTWSNSGGGDGRGGRGTSYMSWGGHVMYLPPAPAVNSSSKPVAHTAQPLSLLVTSGMHVERPMRSKSSGEIELRSRNARASRDLEGEMRERERSASPSQPSSLARALPARIVDAASPPASHTRGGGGGAAASRTRGKRFTFQSTVRQLERRRIAERLSREADLKEQQRRTELEAMRRVEEEFQRKRAREKASIRQQLRLVSGTTSLPPITTIQQGRDEPDGAVSPRGSPALDITRSSKDRDRRDEDREHRHSNASSEVSIRSKSTTPVRCVELSEWRDGGGGARQYRDWGAPPGTQTHNIAHPPACYRMPKSPAPVYLNASGKDGVDTFSGSPRSDNYRLEFARGVPRSPHSPRTPRAPRHPLASRIPAPHSPSSSGSELSARQAIRLRDGKYGGGITEGDPEPVIVPTLHPAPAPPRCRGIY